MKSKTMILMGVAIVCGLLASYMTSRLLAEREQQSGDVEIEKVKVLVAKQSIPYGTVFSEPEKFFQEKTFTKGEEPTNALRNMEDIRGKWLAKPLTAEAHVTKEHLTDKGGIGLGADIPPGYRAIAIRVNAETLAGGFILPRSKVDVICTIAGEESKIILQDMLILAVDQASTRPDGTPTMVGGTVTLQVTPDEAEQLSEAQAVGQLRLVLRGLNDKESVATRGHNKTDAMRRGGRSANRTEEEDATVAGGGALGGTKSPKFGQQVQEAPLPVVKVDDTKKLIQDLYNGTDLTRTQFKLDKDGSVISGSSDGASPPPPVPAPPPPPGTAPQATKGPSTDAAQPAQPPANNKSDAGSAKRRNAVGSGSVSGN